MDHPQPLWNSLEVAKLIVGSLTPILVLVFGLWIARATERFRSALWANQKAVEKRIDVYDKMAPLLNDLYCYCQFVGNWKDLTPPQMIGMKRKLDKTVYVYAALFSVEFVQAYERFINACFETYVEPGLNARLRTPIESLNGDRRAVADKWDKSWDQMFSPVTLALTLTHEQEIKDSYNGLMARFAAELGVVSARANTR